MKKGEGMYRFSIGDEDWVIVFSQHLSLEKNEKDAAIHSIAIMGPRWSGFSHGESFVLFLDQIGAVVIRIEKIPSLILTVSAVGPRNRWFIKDHNNIIPIED